MTNDFVLISTKNTKKISFGVIYWNSNFSPDHSSHFIEKEAQFQKEFTFSILFSKALPFLVVQTAIIWKQCWEMIGKRLERPHIEELRVAVDFWYQDIQAG